MAPENDNDSTNKCGEYPAVTIANELQHIRQKRLQDVYRRLVDQTNDGALCRLASHAFDAIDSNLEALELIAGLKGMRTDGR